ncbi:MAG: FAD-binding oxidoreductase [Alphaproteobacteria bacterium]|nr:FAD-binding oxidoreductase [Alphaproteobacteria bacterium]
MDTQKTLPAAAGDAFADVVIVGGGGVGSAVAYFLSALAGRALRIVVCERDPSYARAATCLAAGGIRQHFSTPENVLMSQAGYDFLLQAPHLLAVNDIAPDMGLKPHPYLRLEAEADAALVREQAEMQRSLGATPVILGRDDLARRFPWMNVEDIGIAVLGGAYEGVFDPQALLHAFRRKAIAQGVVYRAAEVVGLRMAQGGRMEAVCLADGSVLRAGLIVNAAGARAGAVAAMAGIDLPVGPLKAHTFAFQAADPVPGCPIVLDHVAHLNFKPEGHLFLAASPRESVLHGDDDYDVAPDLFENHVWPALAHRVPRFERLRLQRGWVGHIEWNAFDGNPVLGPHPACANFVFACGLSGHGVQHLVAVGRAIAELLVHGGYRSLDLARFAYGRIAADAPVRELV